MELRHLKYFLMVAEELSFVRASEKLFISQPPLSRQIKELEDEIGTRLFNRNNKRVELTEAGKYFQKEVKEILLTLESVSQRTKKVGDNLNGEFRIGYISSTFSRHISDLIKYLSEEYPFVNFRLYEVPSIKQIVALEQGKLDLGILRGPLKSPKLMSELWFQDSYAIVFNKNSIKIKTENDVGQLSNERFIFYNKSYAPSYYETLLQICSKFGFAPQIVHESNNVSSILQLVKEGLGASILPTNSIKNNIYNELDFIELKSVKLFSDVLLSSPKSENSSITKNAIQFLKNLRISTFG
ncbi:LysR family transcriptional regulator [Belliella kenyensis]|uniref:LysR family transcriptional regulator n=1 Tax=Belliella kenyensis TaxID=1472724 RepID=A0ABV8EN76_9BACT|nr:LysR family transcriptional regulator [Belliella kenyensis]MCH7400849.1 LysR family transcriptional regulator [Belliella kenyensis]MDN3601863.1 LysR family transcriptional regulator [Belliella kenyensis]